MQDVLDIEVTPLASACGAEIKGVDLTKPLSAVAPRESSRTTKKSCS
jgi:hypothetical protein